MKTLKESGQSRDRKVDVYQMITDRIITALESGTIPWKKSWKSYGLPQNYATKHVYSGINALITSLSPYEMPYFLTFKQARGLGGSVKKGAKSLPIVYWDVVVKDENGQTVLEGMERGEKVEKYFFAKYYSVFNIEEVDGIDFSDIFIDTTVKPLEVCEYLLEHMPDKPIMVYGGDQPFYAPPVDTISTPHPNRFHSPEAYYSTLFHELIHSTGHKSRLHRPEVIMNIKFGSMDYSKEELVAEIGAAFLCHQVGIETHTSFENKAAYIDGWLSKLRGDKRFVFQAAKEAKKAVEYITNV